MFDERDLGRGLLAVASRGVFVKGAAAWRWSGSRAC